MKRYAAWMGLAIVLVGCRNYRQNDVVQETYIHKYGVPVTKEDWKRNGKDGQVVVLKNNGVTVTKTYDKGVLHGKSTYTFPNSSTLATLEQYEAGQLVSKTEHYSSGIPKQQQRFAAEKLLERICWYEDGTPAYTERYENDLIVSGEYRSPLNEIESKVCEGAGVRIMRDGAGELLFKDTIAGGQMIERVAYYPNGEPSSISAYQEGVLHGPRQTFLHGGLPNTVEEWAHGLQDGVTTIYQNGEKLAEMPYVKGKREGMERIYRDGHLLAEEVCWKNDEQHGPRKIHLEGNTSKTQWYHHGAEVSRTTFERMNPIIR